MAKGYKKTNPKIEKKSKLYQFPCIYDIALFGEFFLEALIDLSSKVNAMQPNFV